MAGDRRKLCDRDPPPRRMAGADHTRARAAPGACGDLPRIGGRMTRMTFIFTTVAMVMVAVLLFLLKDGAAEPVVMRLTPGPSQPRVSPGEAGIDPAALAQAVDYAGERNSHALVVARGGHIVFEKYWGDTSFDTPVDPGFAPVLVALVAGTAMNDRLIINLDRPVSNYLDGAGAVENAASLR